jgi:hypothetical protein
MYHQEISGCSKFSNLTSYAFFVFNHQSSILSKQIDEKQVATLKEKLKVG